MAAHAIVLRPTTGSDACSLTVAYHKPVASEQAALLIVEIANPRVLALFR